MKYVASSISQMTDYDKYYVYTGHEEGMVTGCWYFWSGTEWLIGGDYQCGIDDIIEMDTSFTSENLPANAKAVGDMIVVSDTEPTSPHTELWIDPDTESVLVPTMDDIEGTYAKKSEVDSTYARKAAVGSPLRAATASAMTDVTKIYVYTGSESGYTSGHWYYYDGSSWSDGGVYNSTAFVTDKTLTGYGEAADAKTVGDEITDLKSAVNNIERSMYNETVKSGTIFTVDSPVSEGKILAPSNVDHYGINLLEYPYFDSTRTSNGITYTVNSDGTIHVSGTATANSNFELVTEITGGRKTLKPGTYTLSGCPSDGGSGVYSLFISGLGQGILNDYGNGVTFTITENKNYYLKISVASGQTVDTTFYPQLQIGSHKTSFEPYVHETILSSQEEQELELFTGINTFVTDSACTVTYLMEPVDSYEPILTLSDFGAVGDGITDDTDSIKEALLAASGKTLFIPEGTYLFSETLFIKSGTCLRGCGATSKFLLSDVFTLTPYNWRTEDDEHPHRYPMIATEDNSTGCVLENFALEGQSDHFYDKNGEGLYITGTNHIVRNLNISKINYFPESFSGRTESGVGYGVRVGNAQTIIVDNCTINECEYQSIGVEDVNGVTISNNTCGDACQTGIQVHRNSKSVKIIGNSIQYSSGLSITAITLHADVGREMDDIHIIDNYLCSSITCIGGGENNIFVVNNRVNGAITMNGKVYRKKWIIIGNDFSSGGITARIDDVIVSDNFICVNVGYLMINLRGYRRAVANNVATGTVDGIRQVDREDDD